jgi:glycosyltransferase involved in cell wall biosynthesis
VYWLTEEFPPEVGGTGLVAAAISRGLVARNIAVQVVTRQTRPPCAPREQIDNVRVRRIAPAGHLKGVGWRALPAMFSYLVRLLFLLIAEARHYDVVVVSCMKIIPLVAIPVCRVLRKKCIVRLESPFEMVEPIARESLDGMNPLLGTTMVRLLRYAQRAVLTHADCVVAISKEIEGLIIGAPRPPQRIVRIPNAVDLARFKPVSAEQRVAIRRSLSIPEDRTIALFAGRVSRAKGIAMLVEQWPRVVARHPELLLLIVGTGQGSWDNCEDQINELLRSGELRDHVKLVGQSDRVTEYMQAADFFVFPSEYEGFSLAVTEALGCALPAVLTSVGVASELVVDGINGFLFPPKDEEALTHAIQVCLDRRGDWPAIGRCAREAVSYCDKPRVFDQYAALCRELCPR